MKSYIVGLMALCAVFASAATVDAADIHDAAIRGDWNAIQQELHKGVDVNCVDNYGGTALTFAARRGHTEVVKTLLQVPGIDVNHADMDGATALIYAAEKGHPEVVKDLLQSPDIDANRADRYGNTALICVAGWGSHSAVVKILLQSPGIDVNYADNNGNTALIYAAWYDHPEVVKHLLQFSGVDVNHRNNGGYTALSLSVRNTDEIKQLIQAHIDELEAIKRAGMKAKSARK